MDSLGDAIVNVLAIIGIIIAGGFIMFFLGKLLLSIFNPIIENNEKEKAAKEQAQNENEEIREQKK